MIDLAAIAALAAVFAGATSQRVTGMGFALLAAPFLVLALGPLQGVMVANTGGLVASLLNGLMMRRDIDWSRLLWITPAAVLGCLPGLWVTRVTSVAALTIIIAAITLVALLVTLITPSGHVSDTRMLRTGVGFVSGFITITAAVGGPPVAIYRRLVEWDLRAFTASAQVHFGVTSTAALALNWQAPAFPGWLWPGLAGAVIAGVILGARVARWVPARVGLRLVMVIALAGTLATLARGILDAL